MSKKKKNRFAEIIIVTCVIVCIAISVFTLHEYHRLNETIPSNVLMAMYGFFGGELFFVALRQIFGSDALNKNKMQRYESEESI